jgi:hypothetical protein
MFVKQKIKKNTPSSSSGSTTLTKFELKFYDLN